MCASRDFENSDFMMPAYRTQHELGQDNLASPSMVHHAPSDRWLTDESIHSRRPAMASNREPFQAGYYVPVVYVSHDSLVENQHDSAQREQDIDYMMRHGYDYENPFAARYPTRKYNDPVGYAAESATPSPRVTAKDSSTSSAISWETTTPLHPNSRLSGDINGYYDSPNPTVSTPSANIYYQTSISTACGQMQHVSGLPKDAAHQPISLEQQSSYSELSMNLQFMDRLKREEKSHASPCLPVVSKTSTSKPEKPTTTINNTRGPEKDAQTQSDNSNASASATYMGTSMPTPPTSPALWAPTRITFVDSRPRSEVSAVECTQENSAQKSIKEAKKPSLACEFCKERKIACGRPPEGSEDPTCNQCKLRSFKCIYPKERIPRRPRSRK